MHHSPICETFQSSQLHKCLLLHKLNIVCNYIHDVSHIYPSHFIFISIVLGRTPTMSMSGKYSHWSSYNSSYY